jgi:hypothetical protein
LFFQILFSFQSFQSCAPIHLTICVPLLVKYFNESIFLNLTKTESERAKETDERETLSHIYKRTHTVVWYYYYCYFKRSIMKMMNWMRSEKDYQHMISLNEHERNGRLRKFNNTRGREVKYRKKKKKMKWNYSWMEQTFQYNTHFYLICCFHYYRYFQL